MANSDPHGLCLGSTQKWVASAVIAIMHVGLDADRSGPCTDATPSDRMWALTGFPSSERLIVDA